MSGDKLIITILSDSPFICTGYSTQAKLISKYLSEKGHEVHFLANGHLGKTISYSRLEDGTEFNYKIYGRLNHQYFADIISEHLKKTKSDIFLILLDTFMLHGDPKNPQNGWFLKIDHSPAQAVFWYPTDGGGGLPIGCDLILKKCEKAVCMSKFGQKQVNDYYKLNTDYIPLGTELDRFKPYSKQEKELLKTKWGFKDKFIVGSVARNQPRKMMDREIKAFKLFSEKVNNAVLLLHTDPNDVATPFSLIHLVKRLNLENKVFFTGMNAFNAFDWAKMNEVYNLFDVFILTTSGEGFGIPIIEAEACEIPVLTSSYTTTAELVEQPFAGYGIKLVGTEHINLFELLSQDYDYLSMNGTITGSWEVERGICDIQDLANKLLELYNNPKLRETMGKNGREFVLNNYEFNKHVGPKFEELFKSLI